MRKEDVLRSIDANFLKDSNIQKTDLSKNQKINKSIIFSSGTTTVGLICKDAVVLGTDKRATMAYFIASKISEKLFKIQDHLWMTTAGSVADAQYIIDIIRAETTIYHLQKEKPVPIKSAGKMLSNLLYRYKLFPFQVGLILGGVTKEEGPVLLDIGAYGLVVPWVNTRVQAEMAVKATRYAPEGLRGCGPRRAAMFDPDYLATADNEILVITQIETKQAVENIEDILSVDGIDVSYIGPADLSASYGHLGNMSHPDVQEAIDIVYKASRAAGVATGIHFGSGKTIMDRMQKGYDFITVGNDLLFFRAGAQNALKQLGKLG